MDAVCHFKAATVKNEWIYTSAPSIHLYGIATDNFALAYLGFDSV
jgi:hypothetical protein